MHSIYTHHEIVDLSRQGFGHPRLSDAGVRHGYRTRKRSYTKGLAYDGEFRGLKDLSLEACRQCWFYEFARERPHYREGIAAWRRQKTPACFSPEFKKQLRCMIPADERVARYPFLGNRTPETEIRIPRAAAKLLPWPIESPDAAGLLKLLEDQDGQLSAEGLEQLKGCLAILGLQPGAG